jgi:Mn-dependent DtxR family transcriptional regulator
MVSAKTEDYLEVILELSEYSKHVSSKAVADRLGITQPSVVSMFTRLDGENLLRYTKYAGVVLTRKGKNSAYAAKLRREVFSRFFSILGLDDESVEKCARCVNCEIPPQAMIRLDEFVDFMEKSDCVERWKAGQGEDGN